MTTSEDVLPHRPVRVESEELRQRLAEALTTRYTHLSEIAHEVFTVTGRVEAVHVDQLRTADQEILEEELRRCEVALARLSHAFTALAGKLGRPYDD